MNAVTKVMFVELEAKLKEWEGRNDVQWIMWRGEVPLGKTKAFCAGGELSQVVGSEGIESFIGPEYILDHYIATYKKPQIAVWDGIVMGAGFGLTGHSSIRIATENTQFAMPEARFGLIADIGCAYLLTTAQLHRKEPGIAHLGKYLTLTADRLRGGSETVFSGVATHSLPSNNLPALFNTLCRATAEFFEDFDLSSSTTSSHSSTLLTLLNHIVDDASSPTNTPTNAEEPKSRIQTLLPHIQDIFGLPTLEDVYNTLKRLDTEDEEEKMDGWKVWIKFCLNAFEIDCCPISIAANFEMMNLASRRDFSYADSLINDYRAAVRVSLREDIQKGSQAILLKTGPPKWSPSHIKDVDPAFIKSLFAPLNQFPTEKVNQDLNLPTTAFLPSS